MPDIALSTPARPVLPESEATLRVTLLAELQSALAAPGIQSVLVRNRRLVLRASGPWEPSGPTEPHLHVFLADGTEKVTTDGTKYHFTSGPAYPADDPQAAAADLRAACYPSSDRNSDHD